MCKCVARAVLGMRRACVCCSMCGMSAGTVCVTCAMFTVARVWEALQWAPLQASVTHWSQFVWDFPDWETLQSKANPLPRFVLVLPGPPSAPCGGVWRPLLAQLPLCSLCGRGPWPPASLLSPLPLRCCCLLLLSGPTRDSLQSEATRGTGPSTSPQYKTRPKSSS